MVSANRWAPPRALHLRAGIVALLLPLLVACGRPATLSLDDGPPALAVGLVRDGDPVDRAALLQGSPALNTTAASLNAATWRSGEPQAQPAVREDDPFETGGGGSPDAAVVQFGVYPSQRRAQEAMRTLQSRLDETAPADRLRVVEGRNPRRMVWRVRSAPLSIQDARRLCATAAEAGFECLVVRRVAPPR